MIGERVGEVHVDMDIAATITRAKRRCMWTSEAEAGRRERSGDG